MATIVLFHSVLGVREGIKDAARRLTLAGHTVQIIDQYEGLSFNDYPVAMDHMNAIGMNQLMEDALNLVENIEDGFFTMGFSNGAGMAEYVSLHRETKGAILVGGALPLHYLDTDFWPESVPIQIHQTVNDPFTDEGFNEDFMRSVARSGSNAAYFLYPGQGHLFTDPSLEEEYDPTATALLWDRILSFNEDVQEESGKKPSSS